MKFNRTSFATYALLDWPQCAVKKQFAKTATYVKAMEEEEGLKVRPIAFVDEFGLRFTMVNFDRALPEPRIENIREAYEETDTLGPDGEGMIVALAGGDEGESGIDPEDAPVTEAVA